MRATASPSACFGDTLPVAYVCRRCKGPPLPQPPEDGRCLNPACGGFYRHERVYVRDGDVDGAEIAPIKDGEPMSMADLMAGEDSADEEKRLIHSPGVDYITDGGIPRVGAVLISAKEGIGKTTWLFGLLHKIAEEQKVKTLYISSEQGGKGLRSQFKRLNLKPSQRMIVLNEVDKDSIIRHIEKIQPEVLVTDSLHEIENVTDESGYSMASGSGPAVTRVAKEIRRLADDLGFFAFLVGHMNNDGTMAGSAHLRHAVDGTLGITFVTDKKDPRRIMQFEKCRFAPTDRQALFHMTERGMIDKGPLIERPDDEPRFTERNRGGLN